MLKFIKYLVFKIVPTWRFMNTYSQAGEDVVMSYFFNSIGVKHPNYIDIGTNNPIYGNNTFLFYKRGSTGVCVEADPSLFPSIKKERSRDICLNVGVTFNAETNADFYIFEEPAHNTLSKEEAEHRNKVSKYKLKEVINIPLININDLIEEQFHGKNPNIISIDVEGIDFEILKTIDFNKYKPDMFCVETLKYPLDPTEWKIKKINEFMISKGYVVYGDTYINTLFVNPDLLHQMVI